MLPRVSEQFLTTGQGDLNVLLRDLAFLGNAMEQDGLPIVEAVKDPILHGAGSCAQFV